MRTLKRFLAPLPIRSCKRAASATSTTSIAASAAASGASSRFFIESYGCAMNANDTDIVKSILLAAGHEQSKTLEEASLILLNTCAIRENAESKIWHRLSYLNSLRRRPGRRSVKIGVLGCMAERLKERLLDEESVDLVCGPDAYRDIPRLVGNSIRNTGLKEANTLLSVEETYADIMPARDESSCSSFVSIMRGCNNMCSFCIVPFTRGRERSRPMQSILNEVKALVQANVKEVTLLGQNVNGYHDSSPESALAYPETTYMAANGFDNLYKSKSRAAPGARFADLLDQVSLLSPDLRVRFTSPHPKDFNDNVLQIVASRSNICKSLHLPLQSGSTSVLSRMRRGYSREAFLDLVHKARSIIPDVSLSTDVIAGFCGETEEEHKDTVDLMKEVEFDQAFMFAYSMREKTHAHHALVDDVPEEVKLRRLQEIIDVYREGVRRKNQRVEDGQYRYVLCEGEATRSTSKAPMLTGRTDGNKRVVFPAHAILASDRAPLVAHIQQELDALHKKNDALHSSTLVTGSLMRLASQHVVSSLTSNHDLQLHSPQPGDYVLCKVMEAAGPTLRAASIAVQHTRT